MGQKTGGDDRRVGKRKKGLEVGGSERCNGTPLELLREKQRQKYRRELGGRQPRLNEKRVWEKESWRSVQTGEETSM